VIVERIPFQDVNGALQDGVTMAMPPVVLVVPDRSRTSPADGTGMEPPKDPSTTIRLTVMHSSRFLRPGAALVDLVHALLLDDVVRRVENRRKAGGGSG